MLYKILSWPARVALHFYCRQVVVNRPDCLRITGPVILAANHPNSFLDAIICASLFKEPVTSLARGDAFVSPAVRTMFESLNMLPVYRVSEGVENIKNNYSTFDRVHELLKENKIVLIFSEGRCINEWHLRPLKKGTARIALAAWADGIPLRVLPVGINYSSYRHFGKKVILNFGNLISRQQIPQGTGGHNIGEFNRLLRDELSNLVLEIPLDDLAQRRATFSMAEPGFKKALLFVPAMAGYIMNGPLYMAAHLIIRNTAKDHYDSIMVGILFLFYPLYILAVFLIIFFLTHSWFSLLLLAAIPLSALALLHYRPVVERK